MSLSKYERIVKILEEAGRPLLAREIAAKDPRLESREVGIVIYHRSPPGKILVIEQGDARRYRLTREVRT